MIRAPLKFSSEKSTDRSKLPDQRVVEIKTAVNSLGFATEDGWLISLIKAVHLKEQIAVVTAVFQERLKSSNDADVTDTLKILMDVYLKLPQANPLKKYILSSLSELEWSYINPLTEVISDLLINRFSHTGTYEDSDAFISLLNCINTCFVSDSDSFITICSSSKIIFISVKDMVSSCSSFLSESSVTPIFKERMLRNIHNLTQGVITFIRKISVEYIPDVFLVSCLKFLDNDDLPLNTKTNIAIIIAMINELSHTFTWEQLIEKFLVSTPITLVSLFSGIFSAAQDSLWKKLENEKYLADYMLEELLTLGTNNSSDCKLVLGISRCVNQYTKVCLSADLAFYPGDLSIENVLNYLWLHLEHPMDAVRHLTSESLSIVVSLGSKHSESRLIGRIMSEVINIPLYRRSKYVILSSLVGYIPVDVLLKEVPNLVQILLLSIKECSGAKHVVVSFEKLINQHFTEIEDKHKWLQIWVDPLILSMNQETTPFMEQILFHIIKINPSVIDYIFGLDDNIYCNKIKIILLSLKVGQKVGALKNTSEVKWKGFIDYSFLESCIHHRERDARLSLFGLIVESPKSNEIFTLNELNLIKTFIAYNINCQSASFRQNFIALFKKFLTRLSGSHSNDKCILKNCNYNKDNSFIISKESGLKDETNCAYFTFLEWLIVFCCDQLFPGSSFSRRSTVLNMLSLIFAFDLVESSIFTKKMAQRLLSIIQVDTYEENKKLAKEIIQKLNFNLLGLDNEKKIYDAFSDCLTFASSIRPPDCISSAYCLSALLKFDEIKQVFCDLATCVKGLKENDVMEIGLYYCLSLIIDDLAIKAEVAAHDIHKAAKEGPLYGLIFVIRHILQDLNLQELSNDVHWIRLIKYLIQIGIQCTIAVSCIVNNSSPEGHLPMDLSIDFSNLNLADGTHQATSQLLLLCSWRTVKEVCLLFGEIVERVDIHPEDDGVYFSVKDILTIGEHLTMLLSEIKHRGAFEQAYIGFCKLATTLWKYPKGHLHELPSLWLEETLEEIVSSKSKLCATRRSAGIPFIIQALIVTERDVLGGKQLGWTVQKVLELGYSSENWETRVHAMNILRSLYRNSHLGEAISPFVAQGFIISFKGFSAETWPERNSATLLFSALVTRVFGVNRSRSHCLSWKNKMTGRIFFQRYPELYSVILNKLKECSETDIHSVFPVLLLLGRLYPSSLEGCDSNLKLENMIPFITKCGGSHIMKIRSLAASALVGLIYPFNICEQINNSLNDINDLTLENSIHGYLLQIFHLLKSGAQISNDNTPEFQTTVNTWFDSVVVILKSDNHSMHTKSTCVNILFQFILKYFNLIRSQSLDELYVIINGELFEKKYPVSHKTIGISQHLEFSSILLIFLTFKKFKDNIEDVLVNLLKHSSYEVFHIVLDLLSAVLKSSDIYHEELIQLIQFFDEDLSCSFQNILQSSLRIHKLFIDKMQKESLHHQDSVKLMSVVKELPIIMEKIIEQKTGVIPLLNKFFSTDSLKSCALMCLSSYISLKETKLSTDESHILSKQLSESINSDFDCRLATTELLLKNYKTLTNGYSSSVVFSVMNAIIHLICDDNEQIRSRMGDILDEKVDSVLALEKCLQLFNNLIEDKFLLSCALTAWAINPFCEEQYTLEETDKAFDKGDVYSYKEDIILTSSACLLMKKIISETPEILIREIPSDIHEWLDELSGYSVSCRTLHEVLRSYDEYAENSFEEFHGNFNYFSGFSTAFRYYSLINEKNEKIVYR